VSARTEPVPSGAMKRRKQLAPLPDERVLELVGEKLAELAGELGQWRVVPGPLLKGPGTLGVRVATHDTDDFRHVDLEFLLNIDRAAETSVVDCASGLASDPEEAIRQAVAVWAETTASVVLEFISRRGTFAGHFGSATPGGFPGWYAVIGAISGWGLGSQPDAKMRWAADTSPWTALAPVIATGLDRPYFNGVRIYVGQGGDVEGCEVKINGILHEPSTAALASMSWPRTEQMTTAKTFLLLVHPAEDGQDPG
jgi:hypothetical protein